MHIARFGSASYWAEVMRERGDDVVAALIRILVIVVAYLVIRFVACKVINRLVFLPVMREDGEVTPARKARVLALQTVLKSTTAFVLGFIFVIMVLNAAGINIVPLLTTASVAGLAIGFGAQKLVRDIISGFFILVEDQFGVGDYVTIGAVTGIVEEMGMRMTRIRDLSGKLYLIANGDINQVCNFSRGTLQMSVDIAVPASSDLSRVTAVLDEVGEAIERNMPLKVVEPFKCVGLAQVSGANASLRLTGGVKPRYQDEVKMELNERVREAFAREELSLV